MKVIFVCRGNLIRSQICKALYNHLAKDGSSSRSYGTEVLKDGNEGVELAEHKHLETLIKIMKENGMDISHEKSIQFTEDVISQDSKIIFMGIKSNIPEWLKNYNYEYWEDCINEIEINKEFNLKIKVPKFGDEDDIRSTILLLKNKVKQLLKL